MIPFDIDQHEWASQLVYQDGELAPWSPDKWVIHYGGGANRAGAGWDSRPVPDQLDLEKQVLRGWQNWHRNGRGWFDIAYNYAIGQSGLIYRLRGENRAGATRGDYEPDGIRENHEARAVVFILGGDQTPSPAALTAFRYMWQNDPLPVIGHRMVAEHGTGGTATACPGSFLTAWILAEAFKEAPVTFNYTPPENLTDEEGELFRRAWLLMQELGIFTEYTDPVGIVEAQELGVFLSRLIEKVIDPALEAAQTTLPPGTRLSVQVVE